MSVNRTRFSLVHSAHSDRPKKVENPLACRRPTRDELLKAAGQTMPDILAPHLKIWFCGINPSVYSVVAGHHFARPGNRFWPAMYGGGFTPRLFSPLEDRKLLDLGLGITNMAARSTVAASELSREELLQGAQVLRAKSARLRPSIIAFLGISAFRVAFERPKAGFGWHDDVWGQTRLYILPNPSGLNAHYTPRDLARVFAHFRHETELF